VDEGIRAILAFLDAFSAPGLDPNLGKSDIHIGFDQTGGVDHAPFPPPGIHRREDLGPRLVGQGQPIAQVDDRLLPLAGDDVIECEYPPEFRRKQGEGRTASYEEGPVSRLGHCPLTWPMKEAKESMNANRAGAEKPNMGLTTWKNAPSGKILAADITVAKNYLIEKEIKDLERIVSMYFNHAEDQAARQIPMKMEDWVEKQYALFRVEQDRRFESDFERETKRLKEP